MSSHRKTSLNNKLYIIVGCLLLTIGFFCVSYSYKVSKAQYIYHLSKYGSVYHRKPRVEASQELWNNYAVAYDYYHHNYYFATYAAQCALQKAVATSDLNEFYEYMRKATYYAEQAISLNPYDEGARHIYAETLVVDGKIAEAISYWEQEVIPNGFWNRANHDYLASLYLKSADLHNYEKAFREIPFVGDVTIKNRLINLKKRYEKIKKD